MARISAFDLKQRFSTGDGNIRILQKMKKRRKNQSKINKSEREMIKIFRTLRTGDWK